MDDSSNPRDIKLNRACANCSLARVRCVGGSLNVSCLRCARLAASCVFTKSNKGRTLGSKKSASSRVVGSGLMNSIRTRTRGHPPSPSGAASHGEMLSFDLSRSNPSALPASDLALSLSVTSVHPSDAAIRRSDDSTRHQADDHSDVSGEDDASDGSFDDPIFSLLAHARRHLPRVDEAPVASTPPQTSSILHTVDELSIADAELLAKWSRRDIERIALQHHHYARNCLHGQKRDTEDELDPVRKGLVTQPRVVVLFEAFWKYIHPQWSLLDPELHSHHFVRTRSIFLYTVILAIGSTTLATGQKGSADDVAEAMRLQAYAEQLVLVAFASGFKSCEIIQGHLLFHVWSLHTARYLDDNRCVRLAMCSRMACELGLHRPQPPIHASATLERTRVNDLRTRAFLLIAENRWTVQSTDAVPGVFSSSLSEHELSILTAIPSEKTTHNAAALYILSRFQRDETERLKTIAQEPFGSLRLLAQQTSVESFIEDWIHRWCTPFRSAIQNWYLVFVARSNQLVLYCRVLRQLQREGEDFAAIKNAILDLSLCIIVHALEQSERLQTLNHSMTLPLAALLVGKFHPSIHPAVVSCALNFAGDVSRPGAVLPTFMKFNSDRMMAMLCVDPWQGLFLQDHPDDVAPRAAAIGPHAGASGIDIDHPDTNAPDGLFDLDAFVLPAVLPGDPISFWV